MKRSKALLLLVVLTVLPLGYVGWCWRTFMMGIPTPALSELPENFRSSAVNDLRVAGLLDREPFVWKRAIGLLRMPYETAPPPLEVTTPEAHLVFVRRGYPFPTVVFANYPSGWAKVPDNAKTP